MDYKIIQHLYQVDVFIGLVKMVAIVKLNHGCLQESQKKVLKIDISFTPKLIGDYQFKKVEFKGICSKQNSMYFLHKNVVNLYISDELDT